MAGVNQIVIIGNLGKDPELKYTANGKAVVNFSVAVTEKFGEGKEKTEWFNIVAWEKLAEICGKYLRKGSPVYLNGRVETRKWEDKDGGTRYTTEVIVRNMQMLGSKSDSGQSDHNQSKQGYAPRQGTIGGLKDEPAPYGRPNDDGSDGSGLPF